MGKEVEVKQATIYTDTEGGQPFTAWLLGLEKPVQLRVRRRLDRVEQGNFGDCAPIAEGVHELRIHTGAGYRVYFGEKGETVVLLFGGTKRTQKRDTKNAREYWKAYKEATR